MYFVVAFPVFETRVVKSPGIIFTSILYPVMGEPPLSAGALHHRLIVVGETAMALRSVGGWGFVGGICANTCSVENMMILARMTNVINNPRLNRSAVRL